MKMKAMMAGGMLLAALWTGGCAAPNTSGLTAGMDSDDQGIMQSYLQTDNTRLARFLIVEDVVAAQSRNGLMKANVKLTSRHNKTVVVQSKFAWFDADGMEIDPDGDPWRPLTLHGRETRSIQGVAPSAAAVSFRLRIREGEQTRKFM
ncbi:MAG: YcfL family protein [Verrucomicrobiota bacterium]|jgi:uncharacterized protein YcfL|nr:YcfL family protein [Verrucomicrobiota bacterium]